VHRAHHAGDHESDQGDDRQRYVDVEDLLDEPLIGVVRRVEEDKRKCRGQRRRRGERKTPQTPAKKLRVQVNPP
jgi:hypothetical protein